jgi:hypothetical protein
MLKKLYVDDSLAPGDDGGIRFELENNLATATIVAPPEVEIDGTPIDIAFEVDDEHIPAEEITEDSPFELDKGVRVGVVSEADIEEGAHKIAIEAQTDQWDTLDFEVEDTL